MKRYFSEKPCQSCGEIMIPTSPTQKYCSNCRRKMYLERAKLRYYLKKEGKLKCASCGKIYAPTRPRQRICDECVVRSIEVNREKQLEWLERLKETEKWAQELPPEPFEFILIWRYWFYNYLWLAVKGKLNKIQRGLLEAMLELLKGWYHKLKKGEWHLYLSQVETAMVKNKLAYVFILTPMEFEYTKEILDKIGVPITPVHDIVPSVTSFERYSGITQQTRRRLGYTECQHLNRQRLIVRQSGRLIERIRCIDCTEILSEKPLFQ